MMLAAERWIGPACARSSALPCGMPSTTSTSTTSPSSFSTAYCATEAPTLPAPTTVIFGRAAITRPFVASAARPEATTSLLDLLAAPVRLLDDDLHGPARLERGEAGDGHPVVLLEAIVVGGVDEGQ